MKVTIWPSHKVISGMVPVIKIGDRTVTTQPLLFTGPQAFVPTHRYVPPKLVAMFGSDRVALVAPAMATPLRCHCSESALVAVAVSISVEPAHTVLVEGSA